MALCGFDKQMLEGIEKFHEGLVELIVDKEFLNLENQEEN